MEKTSFIFVETTVKNAINNISLIVRVPSEKIAESINCLANATRYPISARCIPTPLTTDEYSLEDAAKVLSHCKLYKKAVHNTESVELVGLPDGCVVIKDSSDSWHLLLNTDFSHRNESLVKENRLTSELLSIFGESLVYAKTRSTFTLVNVVTEDKTIEYGLIGGSIVRKTTIHEMVKEEIPQLVNINEED